MAMGNLTLDEEQEQYKKILISIIMLYGDNGLPVQNVDAEFINCCGYVIPYKKFGADSLKSWLLTLPDIYLVKENQQEVLFQQSLKSIHIKQLISKQKSKSMPRTRKAGLFPYENVKWHNKSENFPKGYFIHSSINNPTINDSDRYDLFTKLENMLPIFYKHQALGDDFFLDIADTKMGYYVPENGPKECGLCISKQTISDLIEKVRSTEYLAPRVVVMIGFHDLLQGSNVNKMIHDLQELVTELRKKNTRITLITLIPTPKLPRSKKLEMRMDTFNKAIMDYACCDELKCNVIDMNAIFKLEMDKFQKDVHRFLRIAKRDVYKVFSDYGRKVFISTLKSCLKEQIESGH